MTNAANQRIMVIDTETTGLAPRISPRIDNIHLWDSCRIVQIAWSIYDSVSTKLLSSACYIVNPENAFAIPDSAANIHGITTHIARSQGTPINKIIDHLARDIETVSTIVAHNIQFDDNVILSELYRVGVADVIASWKSKTRKCTMLMGTEPKGRWPKLSALYMRLFNKEPEGELHRADTDVRICAECYFRLIQ